jgi:outer membrane protein TolC
MFRLAGKFRHSHKSARLGWKSSVLGALVLSAGCQSTQPPSQPSSPMNSRPVSVYPAVHAQPLSQTNSRPISVYAAVPATQDKRDLVTALQMAGIDNPTINLAREQIREALAQQLSARVLLVPNLNIGGNYHYNNGPVQASSGQIIPVSDQALYMGFGAGAVGAGSVVYPGMWLSAHLGDAVFEPLAARENVAARQSNSVAVQNNIMGDVVTAYLRLMGSEARLDVFRGADVEGAEVVRLTTEFSKAGQGRPADADRAQAFNTLVERERHAAEEEVEVASAQLCRLLNIDPSNRLRTKAADLETFRLIPEDTDLEVLIAQAMQARPELATQYANIRAAQIRVRQEKVKPFLPIISVGISSGGYGGESNLVSGGFSPLAGRTDIDAMAVWNIQNLGFGNRARVKEANAIVGQALAEYESIKNRIRREVADALAESRESVRQLEYARKAALNSKEGFDLDLLRIKGGVGEGRNAPRPIELLDSFNNILVARQELVAAITRFDIAQFRLFVAVGSNPLNHPDVSK